MCKYCDEKALPCLMCGRACMEYQLDRTRCRGCATAHRLPDVWPVFRFCPYCGRDLGKQEILNENQNEGENEMARLIWTNEMDETVRMMEADGASDEKICEALGIEKTQLTNRRYNLKCNERKTCTRKYVGPEQADDEAKDKQGGGILSDTERGLVRLVEEKEEELQKARQEARWFQDKLDREVVEGERLRKKLAEKDRIIVKMVAEIYGEV